MTTKNLIVGRSGEKSLHLNWLTEATPNFDLVVTFYGNNVPENWASTNHYYDIVPIKGGKWTGLYDYFKSTDIWRSYDYIMLPDDDLLASASDMNRIFEFASQHNADLCQPALDRNSYFSHPITLKHNSFNYRITNFVELMIPCLSRRMLEATLELFNESNSGWGMDNYWWELISKSKFSAPMIIDDITITHTRPVGSAGHGTGGASKSPHDDLRNLCIKYGFTPSPTFNFGGKLRNQEELVSIQNNPLLFEKSIISDTLSLTGQSDTEKLTRYIINQQAISRKLS